MNTRFVFCKAMPAIIAGIFMLNAGIFFALKYVHTGIDLQPFFSSGESGNRILFYLNFYIPCALCAFALYGCLFLSGFFLRGFCLVIGFAASVVAGYVLDDVFTVKLCIYSAFVLITAVCFSPPKNYIISGLSILLFTLFLFHPSFLGAANEGLAFSTPSSDNIMILVLYMSILAAVMASIRLMTEKYMNSEASVSHLNQVGTKMLLFNHRLQEYVKNSGEEAVKKDRLRFTRDLHDSCGYVFTNIIAITEAAISWPSMEKEKMQETFQLIRNQARDGLKRTRETLHMIRELQDPGLGSIESIYEMKAILEEVTNIKVDIESGNMRLNYGDDVNRVIIRIVQEAFTNSVRHGQASRIIINFWEHPHRLTMTVRDNGIGAQQIVKGIGLAGMEERVAQVGGTLEVSSPEDGGFCLKVVIPLLNTEIASGEER
jgi:signal transduction histidine kinase